MLKDTINITDGGEAYDRKEIALVIRNSTYNDELKCSLIEDKILKDCQSCSLKFICDGIDELADDYIKKTTKVVSSFTL